MKKYIILVLIVFLFSACSSSSDSNSDSNSTPSGTDTQTGVFKDSNVSGLAYTSGSQSGVTNAKGEFTYEVGQTVSFMIGGVSLGTVAGGDVVTPVDLVQNGSSSSPEVQNIVRFLMMLDSDGDPDNGISIPSSVQTIAEEWSQVNFQAGDLEAELGAIVSSAVAASGLSLSLPDASTAQAHMEATLRCTYAGAYEGTYTGGDDNGNFGMVIDARTGLVSGIAYSIPYDDLMALTGSTPMGYSQNPEFVSGNVSGGATFQGSVSGADTLSGTWENSIDGTSGTYSGARIGGALNATYRFTGQFSGDGYGLIAFDIDAGNAVTGIAYGIGEDDLETLSGTLTGTSLSVTTSSGTTASGTLDISTGDMSGTWQDADGSSGTFQGCGCRLN